MKKLPKGKANDWKVRPKTAAQKRHDKNSVEESTKELVKSTEEVRLAWCEGHDEECGHEGGIELIEDILTLAKYGVVQEAQVSRDQIFEAARSFQGIRQAMQATNSAKFMLEMNEQAQQEEYVADFLHGDKGEVPTGCRNTTRSSKYRDV